MAPVRRPRFPRARLALAALALGALAAAAAGAAPSAVQREFVLGGAGGWDYLSLDEASRRLFISRSDRVLVLDTATGAVLATIEGTPGVHGIALAPDLGKAFTSNGRGNSVTVIDLASLKATGSFPACGDNPDAILYDARSGHLLTFNGKSQDISILDPASGRLLATLAAGGKPEFAVSDGAGRVFVNIEDRAEILVLDPATGTALDRWSLPGCEEPTGLSIDVATSRLFSVCGNEVLDVTDARAGKPVASLPIGKGADAAAFDPATGLVFSSNGRDGTLTVVRQRDADHYDVVSNLATRRSARTMALDRKRHLVYLVAADFGPTPPASAEQPRPRAPVLDGSFRVLEVAEPGVTSGRR